MKYLKILGVMLMLTVLSALEMSCGGTNATSMRLVKTEGTVEVADGQGSAVPIKEKLGLYSAAKTFCCMEKNTCKQADDMLRF